jgi:tetratricopeptide (TPR) repeat protein
LKAGAFARGYAGASRELNLRSPNRRDFARVKFVKYNWLLVGVALLSSFYASSLARAQGQPSPASAETLAQAEKHWRSVVQKEPNNAAAFATLGVVFSQEHKYDDAIRAYKRALSLDPKLPGLQLNLGLAHFKRGNFPAAIAPLSAALAADPQSTQARTLLGLSYYGAKNFADASTQLAVIANLDPGNLELRRVLAQSCLWAKKYDCALEQFRQIQTQDPNSAAAHMLSGEALDGLARTPEAISEFEAALKIAPREPEVNFGLGYLHWKLSQFDEATKYFNAELAIDPNHPQALAYLADIAFKNNESEKALPLLQKVVKQRNDIRIAYVDLGAILTQQKRYTEALAALKRAVKLDPSQPDAHFRLGKLHQTMGNMTAAEQEFAKVRELHEKQNEDVASKMVRPAPTMPQ